MKLLKHTFFILFFLTFCCELIQNTHHIINPRPLKGAFKQQPKPTFSLDNWLSGNYQDSVMKHYEQNLDLHSTFIRINNQVNYFCFKEVSLYAGEIGKDNYLFENGYIISYLGENFVGDKVINEKVEKLAFVQAELKKKNVDLIFLIPPSKAAYMPENLPPKYDVSKKVRNNYEAYIEQFEKQKINCVDIAGYFSKLKPVTKYPLFTRCGVHWSGYGATVAADTLIKYMEKQRNIDITDYYYDGGELTIKPRDSDDDLVQAMNLIYDIPSYPMYYPNLVVKKDATKVKPNVLFVGDSFVWSWLGFYKFVPELFSDKTCYWFYNREFAWGNNNLPSGFPLDKKTLADQTLNRDYIIIVNNPYALVTCGNDFIEQMYDLMKEQQATVQK